MAADHAFSSVLHARGVDMREAIAAWPSAALHLKDPSLWDGERPVLRIVCSWGAWRGGGGESALGRECGQGVGEVKGCVNPDTTHNAIQKSADTDHTDIDLVVEEPDGTRLTHRTRRVSDSGKRFLWLSVADAEWAFLRLSWTICPLSLLATRSLCSPPPPCFREIGMLMCRWRPVV